MGNTTGRGKEQRGAGVIDSHAAPVPSCFPPLVSLSGGIEMIAAPSSAAPRRALDSGSPLPPSSCPAPGASAIRPKSRTGPCGSRPSAAAMPRRRPRGTGEARPGPRTDPTCRFGTATGAAKWGRREKKRGKFPEPLGGRRGGEVLEALAGDLLPTVSQEGGAGSGCAGCFCPPRTTRHS